MGRRMNSNSCKMFKNRTPYGHYCELTLDYFRSSTESRLYSPVRRDESGPGHY